MSSQHIISIIVGFGLLLAGPADALQSTQPQEPPSAPIVVATPPPEQTPAVELVDLPREVAEMVDWALSLFAEGGLEMPRMRFVHHGGETDPCRGRDGLHHEVDGVNVVEICATEATWGTQVMVLHETAHAWVDHQLTSERKAEFKALRGWDHWRNYEDAAWHNNGTEQAAEIMVWGLIDRPIKIVRINQATCADLEAGYITLTGEAPPNGFRDLC